MIENTWGDSTATPAYENDVELSDIDSTYTFAATYASGDVTSDATGFDDPFLSWYACPGLDDTDDYQVAISFFEDGSDFYFEVGDTEDVWIWLNAANGVETTAFTFAGAAQLVSAAGAIVVALLF